MRASVGLPPRPGFVTKPSPPLLSSANAPPSKVGGRWRTNTEVVPAPAPDEPWNMSAVAAAAPRNLPQANGLSSSTLKSAPLTPIRDVKDEDVELPAFPTPTTPTMLPEAPANTDESNQEEREQLYVFTEQKRVRYALPTWYLSGHHIYEMHLGQKASAEAPAEYAAASSQEEPPPYHVAEAPLAVHATADDEQSNDPPAIVPAPRQRRATDALMVVGGPSLSCPMLCLFCGYPNLLQVQRDVCPTCSSQDCLIPNKCALAARCKRSGRGLQNVPIYCASTQDPVSKRIANIVLRNAKRRSEHTWLRDPRDTQVEGPERRSVGLTAGSSELRFGPIGPIRSRPTLFGGTCCSWRRRTRRSAGYASRPTRPLLRPIGLS